MIHQLTPIQRETLNLIRARDNKILRVYTDNVERIAACNELVEAGCAEVVENNFYDVVDFTITEAGYDALVCGPLFIEADPEETNPFNVGDRVTAPMSEHFGNATVTRILGNWVDIRYDDGSKTSLGYAYLKPVELSSVIQSDLEPIAEAWAQVDILGGADFNTSPILNEEQIMALRNLALRVEELLFPETKARRAEKHA